MYYYTWTKLTVIPKCHQIFDVSISFHCQSVGWFLQFVWGMSQIKSTYGQIMSLKSLNLWVLYLFYLLFFFLGEKRESFSYQSDMAFLWGDILMLFYSWVITRKCPHLLGHSYSWCFLLLRGSFLALSVCPLHQPHRNLLTASQRIGPPQLDTGMTPLQERSIIP